MSKPPPLLKGTAPPAITLEEGTIVRPNTTTPPPPEADPLEDAIPPRDPDPEPVDDGPAAEAPPDPEPAPETAAEPDTETKTTPKRGAARKPAEAPGARPGGRSAGRGARGRQESTQAATEAAPPAPPAAAPAPRRVPRPAVFTPPPAKLIPKRIYIGARTAAQQYVAAAARAEAAWDEWVDACEDIRAQLASAGADPAAVELALEQMATSVGADVPPAASAPAAEHADEGASASAP